MNPDSAVTIAVVGVLATCVGGLLWIIKYLFSSFIPLLNRAIANIDNNSRITKSADKYLRDRNGRDAEVHQELIKQVKEIPKEIAKMADRNLDAYKQIHSEVKEQHVEIQKVDKVVK